MEPFTEGQPAGEREYVEEPAEQGPAAAPDEERPVEEGDDDLI